MRYQIKKDEHDPRILDLIAALVLVAVVIAACVVMNSGAYVPTTVAGVYPTEVVKW